MNERAPSYLSYLLRIWREERGDEIVWRASLESAQTRERWSFVTVDALVEFIYERVTDPADVCTFLYDD